MCGLNAGISSASPAAVSATSVAQRRNITEKDLFNFVWIGEQQFAPD